MKQLIMSVVIAMFAVCASAQKDVTRFLGIPVDGTKTEMIQKLKAKGFRPTTYDKETLEGEFNGRDVYVSVVTNNNKVWRISWSMPEIPTSEQSKSALILCVPSLRAILNISQVLLHVYLILKIFRMK